MDLFQSVNCGENKSTTIVVLLYVKMFMDSILFNPITAATQGKEFLGMSLLSSNRSYDRLQFSSIPANATLMVIFYKENYFVDFASKLRDLPDAYTYDIIFSRSNDTDDSFSIYCNGRNYLEFYNTSGAYSLIIYWFA